MVKGGLQKPGKPYCTNNPWVDTIVPCVPFEYTVYAPAPGFRVQHKLSIHYISFLPPIRNYHINLISVRLIARVPAAVAVLPMYNIITSTVLRLVPPIDISYD